jgi:hypothetical protein
VGDIKKNIGYRAPSPPTLTHLAAVAAERIEMEGEGGYERGYGVEATKASCP